MVLGLICLEEGYISVFRASNVVIEARVSVELMWGLLFRCLGDFYRMFLVGSLDVEEEL